MANETSVVNAETPEGETVQIIEGSEKPVQKVEPVKIRGFQDGVPEPARTVQSGGYGGKIHIRPGK